ncbi:hypothetical protein [Streptomyces sp. Da 82-17]|uniref:hypothetical protein n=1 Tax=Streptomyces sp. Da 82-17 TaxID=3377116 RepID=UPI0038D3B840
MAIESDQLVFDYLSRVGDLAQQRQLPSKTRMRLVADLRSEIDRRRATVSGGKTPGDSPSGVRRILDRLGTPEEVVDRAAGDAPAPPAARPEPSYEEKPEPAHEPKPEPAPAPEPRAPEPAASGPAPEPAASGPAAPASPKSRLWSFLSVPEQRADEAPDGEGRTGHRRRFVPRPRLTKEAKEPEAAVEPPPVRSTPPHLAGEDEMGPSGSTPDWWRIDDGPQGFTDSVPGFVGGVEIPEILRPPRPQNEDDGGDEDEDGEGGASDADRKPSLRKADAETGDAAAEGEEEPDGGGRKLPFLRRASAARGAPSFSNPLLLLAAAALVVGAAIGNWVALGVGWAIAYTSRRLTQREAKFASLGIPGLAAAAGVVWLWGRFDGRWGEAVPKGATADAFAETWPWVVRLAAVASALFLVWRSQRQRPE